jgi:FdhE protein
VQADLPEPDMPIPDALARARAHAMPPLDRNRTAIDAALETTLDRLLGAAAALDMPDAARGALGRVQAAAAADRRVLVRAVLAQAVPADAFADHVFVAAALHVHLARQAARLDATTLVPVGAGVCPVCGGAPVASMIVGWRGAHNARFCACSLCASFWHEVRIKCTLCGSTKGVAYQELAGSGGTVKAETCETCRGYLKILQQHQDPALDPVADDVASLGLDILLREKGYRRGGVNMFLLGY